MSHHEIDPSEKHTPTPIPFVNHVLSYAVGCPMWGFALVICYNPSNKKLLVVQENRRRGAEEALFIDVIGGSALCILQPALLVLSLPFYPCPLSTNIPKPQSTHPTATLTHPCSLTPLICRLVASRRLRREWRRFC